MAILEKVTGRNEYKIKLNDANLLIGGNDDVVGDKFISNLNIAKWDNECWLNINHPAIVLSEKEIFENGVIELALGNMVHRYYEKAGNLEYEIVLKTKPLFNAITLNVTFPEGLVFYFQPPLTQEEIDDGAVRPDNVVNSYAVYWNKKNNKYKTGKFCHIYRPKITASDGKWVWCELKYVNKKLSITVPQTFLDTAKYPITLDPELGYSTAGASSYGSNTVKRGVNASTDVNGGTTDTWHVAIAAVDAVNTGVKLGIYDTDGAGDPSAQSLIEQVTLNVSVSDNNSTAASGTSLVASTEYCLPQIVEDSDTEVKYDTGVSGDSYFISGRVYASEMVDPWAGSGSSGDKLWSIWVDYSAAAAGGITTQAAAYYARIRRVSGD